MTESDLYVSFAFFSKPREAHKLHYKIFIHITKDAVNKMNRILADCIYVNRIIFTYSCLNYKMFYGSRVARMQRKRNPGNHPMRHYHLICQNPSSYTHRH